MGIIIGGQKPKAPVEVKRTSKKSEYITVSSETPITKTDQVSEEPQLVDEAVVENSVVEESVSVESTIAPEEEAVAPKTEVKSKPKAVKAKASKKGKK